MWMVSSRYGFRHSVRLAEADRVRQVDLDGGPPGRGRPRRMASLLKAVRGRSVLVLVHGYNNTYDRLARAYASIERGLRAAGAPYDVVVGYVWPGGDARLSYLHAKARARRVRARLGKLLCALRAAAENTSVMGHSLGCYLVLLGLEAARCDGFGEIYLMAAAVDDEDVCEGGRFYGIPAKCRGAYVFRSEQDDVLKYGFLLGDASRALGYCGPDDPERVHPRLHVIDCSGRTPPLLHGDYNTNPAVFAQIDAIRRGLRLPRVSRLPA